MMSKRDLLVFTTKGAGSNEEARLRGLLEAFDIEFFPFDARAKRRTFFALWRAIRAKRPRLLVMEGTGITGGIALLLSRWLLDVPYVFSSGDAVAPFIATRHPLLKPLFSVYERLLCHFASGFIGWTPYLVGRALTFGARRAVTAAGWNLFPRTSAELAQGRARVRAKFGIAADEIVVGLVGALVWTPRYRYCYGAELVRAAARAPKAKLRVLIAGDGTGRERLIELAGDQLGKRILLPGGIPHEEVMDYLAAMDVGSLPQSVDGVGSFRYTTKLSEYLAANLPIITGQIPLSYDFDDAWIWRLPGDAPWDERYITALADWMERITRDEIAVKRRAVPQDAAEFDRTRQMVRVTKFINDLLQAER
jgi:glycosyltransferase involved in cell wall biosynthesis